VCKNGKGRLYVLLSAIALPQILLGLPVESPQSPFLTILQRSPIHPRAYH